ncbi:hypothetical protein ACIBSW_37780 [Actinoplanes sp. NPDC049668]|uniref:hypothetical protein n=1 Tax=unclassified Actinoplanes TaxID=2626549 RepID=UPI0033A33876
MTEPEVPPDTEQELAQLRAENERLRALVESQAPPDGAPRRRRRVGRWTAATLCLLIGCLLLPVGAVAVFARTVVFDTDRYVETVAPLAEDPAVRNAVADRITAEVFAALDIEGFTRRAIDAVVKQGAPAELTMLQQPMVNGVRSFARTQVHNAVSSDLFAQAWEQANRAAHAGLVAALRGEQGGAIEVENGNVSVNLGLFIQTIKPRLVEAGVPFADRIPAVNLSFPLVHSDEIPKIQRAAALLDRLAWPLVLFAFLLLAAAVWLAPGRRRMLSIAGLGIALSLLLLLGGLAAGREYYLTNLPQNTLPTDAAAVVWDTLTAQFEVRLQTVVLVGVVIALGAWVVGPGELARGLRTGATRLLIAARVGGRRLGWRPNVVDRWVADHVAVLRAAALALIIIVYVVWTRPTSSVVIWLTLALLGLLAVIELLRRGTDLPPAPDPEPGATAVPREVVLPGT